MYERFAPQARRALVLAQQEARDLASLEVGTEHLLLALCRVDAWVGDLLHGLGATHDRLRSALEPGPGAPEQVPLGTDFKQALEVAARHADEEGRRSVCPEHLLRGVIDVGGVASACLHEVGVPPDGVLESLLAVGTSPVDELDEGEAAPLFPIAPPIAEAEAIGLGAVQAEPRCPACASPVAAAVRHVRVPVDIEVTVDLVYCGRCGHVLTTRIVERG